MFSTFQLNPAGYYMYFTRMWISHSIVRKAELIFLLLLMSTIGLRICGFVGMEHHVQFRVFGFPNRCFELGVLPK